MVVVTGCAPQTPHPSALPPASTVVPSTTASASPTPASEATPDPMVPLHPAGEVTTVATGLDAPWDIVFVDDTALVSERDAGTITAVSADGTMREVATIEGIVHGGEGGVLGLAVNEAHLFVYSTGQNGNRVQRFDITGEPGTLALANPMTIIDGIPSARNHNGGRIALGPDGYLYIATGDGSQTSTSQDLASLGGKILRVSTDGAIPADNPFAPSPVYSLGHRNVQGLGWAADGTMYASEFGQDTWDELNIITPGGNYGWPEHEGVSGAAGFIDPVQAWTTDVASPSGVAVVGGTIYIANLRGRVLREVPVSDPSQATEHYAGVYGRLRDVQIAPDGSLWILTNNTDGRGDPQEGDDRIVRVALTADASS
nr:PQQ-dependent sugar dehydrogenase [Microbacterium sp. NC79]